MADVTAASPAASPAAAAPFVHLHVHTHYSLLDGACRIPDLVKRTKALGMDAIAITDHGCMFGVIEFFNECKKEGIKPILGMEAYMAPGDRRDRSTGPGDSAYHLLLLAQDLEGYRNLIKLSSIAYREGFYYKARVDKAILKEFNKGIIATSACLGGEVCSCLLKRDAKHARAAAEAYLEIFGPERFFIEVQKQGVSEQDVVNPELAELAEKLGVGLVATNDVHFLNREDHHAHDVLCCISMQKLITDEGRLKYPTELYLKSPAEMAEAIGATNLRRWREAMENTRRIADACKLELDFSKRYAPVYRVPAEKLDPAMEFPHAVRPPAPDGTVRPMADDERYLRQLCEQGLVWRYGTRDVPRAVRDRLEYELKVIIMKNFCSYFLIVWDFCNYARDHGIPVGARGSGVGTMVGYLLGLCNVDPIRYNLLFERFMDPSRNEMPDIDIDICQDGRQKVIEYVRNKYGHVAQIITFGTLAARAACKDVGRVLGVPLAEIDKLTKLIPGTPGMTLKKAMAANPELAEVYNAGGQLRQVIDLAMKLEGMCRNAGCHAAGVIIADQPLDGIVPLYKDKDDNVLTQFEGPVAEKCGLLKMDFLGLRTLTTLTRSIDLEKQTREARGEQRLALPHPRPPVPLDPQGRIDIEKIDITDPNVFRLFQRGETKGIFQFESGGMQDLLMKMVPDRIEDLIAANALYRPGPMELIPLYCNRKHGREKVPEVHPIMDAILAETYGIMCYQEQVMQVFNQLGGIELSNAYKLIKAISKKQAEVIARFQPDFIKGTMAKGVSKEKAEEIFDLILKFGGYGFNKCVVGSTVVIDAATGRRATVEELFRERPPFQVHALGDDWKLRPRAVTDVVWNGRKPVFQLVTAQGKRITATANHPFRTLDGWKVLGDLRPGERIAAPRRLDVPTTASWPRHELIALAGLLSEGNTCHPTCLYFFGNDPDLVRDFADAASRFPDSVARVTARDDGRRLEVCVSTGRDARFPKGHRPWNASARTGDADAAAAAATTVVALAEPAAAPARSGAFRWAESLGILGRKASEKSVPDAVFALRDADVELFLGRLWAGDGFIANDEQTVPFYATSSPRLARDVQTLLLRLGILSGVHRKTFKYRGGERDGYTVHLVGEGSIEAFVARVGPHCLGRQRQLDLLRAHVAGTGRGRTSKDTVPADVRAWIDQERRAAGLTWRQLEERSGVCVKELYGAGSPAKLGFRRSTVGKLAAFFASRRLADLAASDVFWDRVVSIEPMGVADTYDLTVEGDHNFVADGLVVHNSHSTRYAFVAYQTAYMKVYHPAEYMAALLTFESGSTEKVVEYIEECRRLSLPDGRKGLKVLPPDVNVSDKDFTPVYVPVEEPKRAGNRKAKGESRRSLEGQIRFGLMAVRGVGEKPVEAIIEERRKRGPFANLFEFCERVDLRAVQKATIEALIKCGAFASMGANRAQLLAILDKAFEMGQQAQHDRRNGQLNMFGMAAGGGGGGGASPAAAPAPPLPQLDELPPAELLKFEKELLGFYLTSHPMTEHQAAIERYSSHSTKDCMGCSEGTEVVVGGMINRVKTSVTKSGRSAGQKMAWITLEDLEGTIDGVIWAEQFAEIHEKHPDAIAPEKIVFLKARIDRKRETPSLVINEVIPVAEAVGRLTTNLVLKLSRDRHGPDALEELKPVLAANRGRTPVFASVGIEPGRSLVLKFGPEHFVRPGQALVEDLERVLGPGSVQLVGAGSKRSRAQQQQQLFQAAAAAAEPDPAEPSLADPDGSLSDDGGHDDED